MAKKIEYFGKRKSSELKASETEKIDRYKERFNKWHAKQIDLLTFSINLVFRISIAFLGFIIDKCSSGREGILIMMGITVTLGILALISRLNDFRVTKNITKSRRRIYELKNEIQYEDTEASDSDHLVKKLNKQRCWTNILGYTTWVLFYIQIISLLLALWFLILQ